MEWQNVNQLLYVDTETPVFYFVGEQDIMVP